MAPKRRPKKGESRVDAALDAMTPYGFPNRLVRTAVNSLLKVLRWQQWLYSLLIETILEEQASSSPQGEREFLVDIIAAPGTLIPADILSTKDSAFKSDNPKILFNLPSIKDTEFSNSRLIPPSHGECSNQNPVIRYHLLPCNEKSYFEKPEPSNLGSSRDTGVGPFKIPNRGTPHQLENLLALSGTCMY